MEFKHIELHTKEGEYFVKCYKSEKPEKIIPTKDGVGRYNEDYEALFNLWQQSAVIYPVHESQVERFYKYVRSLSKPVYLFPKDEAERIDKILKQGISITASKVEIKSICKADYYYCSSAGQCSLKECKSTSFAFLLDEVKEETNEETQSAILQDLLDIANSNILPPHLKLKRIYEQFTIKRK